MNEPYFDSSNETAAPSAAMDAAPAALHFRNSHHRELTRLEKELLDYLTANCGRPVSRHEILSSVWRLDPALTVTRTVDMHIAKLRHKLQAEQNSGRLLTVRGHGYMLVKQI